MHQEASSNSRKNAYFGILLLGIVSLMGDVVYEGSRGIVPGYLEFLGATALIVGLVGGLGDFLGYALRLVSGFLADTTRAYWLFIFLGYGLIVSIPLLGFPLGLGIAVILVLLERFGKAFRSPSRDTILSIISKDVGAGKAFGIHELLDQIGAILGPLMVAFLMLSTNNYSFTFSFLFLPFLVLLVVLAYTYRRIGSKTFIIESQKIEGKREKLARPFYIYTFAVLLNTVGLIPYTLILYKASEILQPTQQWIVPLIYLLIQGVDAPMALIAGYAYDKFGIGVLVMPFLLSLFPPLLTMVGAELSTLIAAAIVFGLVLGTQESIYRAAVSELTPISSRGTAYGIFNTAYGVGFLISGALYGLLMELKPPFIAVIFYVSVTQIIATASLLSIRSELKTQITGKRIS
ncbi:MAG: MFS transporter [Candidatus Bathyarchaeota archaeon]|nr:MFS transporter [Candidatus Bathyarchaeota archaeon]